MTTTMYRSTRGDGTPVTASLAILKGLAPDGGLYVPVTMPHLDVTMEELSKMDYKKVACAVMAPFLGDFTKQELESCVAAAYDSKFDTPQIAPLVKVGDFWHLELFHGATIAFKDMALSLLPHLMTVSAKKNSVNDDIVILTATSGDTGKAALAGFAGVEGTKIIVFYPKNGVSPIQERQMVTQEGDNTLVAGIMGNFDDAQNGVKDIFSDRSMEESLAAHGYRFSSANSINIGRLVPQVVYYAFAYSRLLLQGVINDGEKINFVVPTGNFGNILAGYWAKQIGVPINRLVCASNENKVLYDFFATGTYDKNRKFILTSSPSMDILISSNLERLIFTVAGNDPKKCAGLMAQLREKGIYAITDEMKKRLSDFCGYFTDEAGTARIISEIYKSYGYICDTHTAVAAGAARQYRAATKDMKPTVVVSTASPYKFTRSVMTAIDPSYDSQGDFALVDELCRISGVPVPRAIEDIRSAPVRHKTVCSKQDMREVIRGFLNIPG